MPWQIHLALTIPKQAGSEAQQLHRDGELSLLNIPGLTGGGEHAISVIWALDGDFTEERGTTRVVLGSHDWPLSRGSSPKDSVPALMKQGSAFIYTGRTIHGAGHNATASPRVALNVAYNSACLKQEENLYVAIPADVKSGLPEMLQQLVWTNA